MTRARWTYALLLVVASCGMATATPEVHEIQLTQETEKGRLAPGEALVAVNVSASEDILQCVHRTLSKPDSKIRVLPPSIFRDAMYPWFEPNTAPSRTEELARLLARPHIKDRISDLGIRYVLAIRGRTTSHTSGASGVGVAVWNTDKRTEISAVILDLKEGHLVKSIYVSADGEGASGVIGFVPYVFLPPATEAISCEALANQIIAFLNGAQSVTVQ